MNSIQRISRQAGFMGQVVKARIVGKPVPLYASLAVTARCNLKCSFCFGRYYAQKIADISLDDVCDLIDHLGQQGTAHFNINGGEPLMREDIGAIIDRSLRRGLLTSISTNGIFIDRYLDDLAKLDFVCVSVDGDEKAHDRVRGEGTHRIIMNNIKLLRKRGVPVQVTCLLTRHNLGNLRWIFDAGRKMGFTVKLLIPNVETEYAPRNRDVAVTDAEIRTALGKVIAWQKEGLPVEFSSTTYNHTLNWPRSYWQPIFFQGEDYHPPPWPCYAGKYWCQIDADGKVYPCCAMFNKFPGLDFREVGFEHAFANLKIRKCVSCTLLAENEFNQLIALRPRPILENIYRSLKRMF